MDLKILERMESEIKGGSRPFPVEFSQARGSVLVDESGKEYIDFCSGAGALSYGHHNPVLKARLADALHANDMEHGATRIGDAREYFLQVMNRVVLAPRGLRYLVRFTGPTATNAIETALKLARRLKGRRNVISFTHGVDGISDASLTGATPYRPMTELARSTTRFMPYDGYFGPDVNTMAYLERSLRDAGSGPHHPAAVIVETVQGEGGVNVASQRWLRELERLCREHDMLLIVDDTHVGCGRTGSFFSFESAGISPDIVTLSKSLSGFGLPMSLVLFKPELDIGERAGYGGGFSDDDLAFITAGQALETYWSDERFSTDICAKERQVRDWLENLAHSYRDAGLSVRGRGLIQGVVTPLGEGLAERIARHAFETGVVIDTSGSDDEVLKVLPALTITADELARGLEIIERSTAEVLAQ